MKGPDPWGQQWLGMLFNSGACSWFLTQVVAAASWSDRRRCRYELRALVSRARASLVALHARAVLGRTEPAANRTQCVRAHIAPPAVPLPGAEHDGCSAVSSDVWGCAELRFS